MAQIRFNRVNPSDLLSPLGKHQFVLTDFLISLGKQALMRLPEKYNGDKGEDKNFDVNGLDGESGLQSILGTPIYDNLYFGHQVDESKNNYYDLDGNLINYSTVRIDTVIMVVTQEKNIVSTQIQGRNGTIKQYIGAGDYEISVIGAIVNNESNAYPQVEMDSFMKIINSTGSIKVTSAFLQLFEINDVVIKSISFAQEEGVRNMQRFELVMLSDSVIDLEEVI